jgi:octaprenyl-diphosphate synthase
MDIEAVYALLADDMRAVDRLIRERLQSSVWMINQLGRYIIEGGGKRLRPMVLLLSARAFGYTAAHHIPLAAVIEFIHTATLLHDDVVDESDLRRGRQTANAIWGNQASVLVGDFLYSRSFQIMVEVNDMRIMQILADATNTIAEGEVLQLLNCHDATTTEGQYLEVIRYKTAKLFEAAAQLGTVLCGCSPEEEQALARYGMHLGMAYQLIDDVLDFRSSTTKTGKNIGNDLAEGKPTLPLIYAMRTGTPEQGALVRQAVEHGGREDMEAVIDVIESTHAIAYTANSAWGEARQAMQALDTVRPSPYRDALIALAEFSTSRTF